ncbi:S1 RNA-binding domain-containing protein, partial [Alicyclobacillaceae bacterium I2511]
ILTDVLSRFGIQVIAIGNGTASRETEEFVVQMLTKLPHVVAYTLVSEAGASVYSASKLAGAEFPQLDVSQRSAISIARRLQDPLAELVKIDPQSIGVGQYQHDLRTSNLADELQFVVESAVNHVGVDVNTASVSLLQYVSGVSPQVAQNIVAYREEHGKFRRRTDLLQVPRLGEKAYEQCIGFLRIRDGDTLLDNTPIHPESYANVNRLLTYASLYAGLPDGAPEEISMEERLRNLPLDSVAKQLEIGEPTLRDIVEGLLRPGRDPREDLPQPLLRKDVLTLENLEIGMELQGTVRNVVDFGAFVDIGLKNDALVHISKIAQGFVLHPLDRVSVGQVVTVWVAQVDAENKRVSLTMVQPVPTATTKDEYIPKA